MSRVPDEPVVPPHDTALEKPRSIAEANRVADESVVPPPHDAALEKPRSIAEANRVADESVVPPQDNHKARTSDTARQIWSVLGLIFLAGCFGGLVNALLSPDGLSLPRSESGIINPGFIGNILIAAAAACVSFGLYGPLAAVPLFRSRRSLETPVPNIELTVSAFVGAILVAIGGARWMTSEVERTASRQLAATAGQAAVLWEKSKAQPQVEAAQAPGGWVPGVNNVSSLEGLKKVNEVAKMLQQPPGGTPKTGAEVGREVPGL
jgi:hypothetical protein